MRNKLITKSFCKPIDRRSLLLSLAGAAAALHTAPGRAADEPPTPNPQAPRVLRAGESAQALDSGMPDTRLWTFDGTFPGPVLRVRKGEELALQLQNGLSQPTTLHWHGVRLANAMDGVAGLTQPAIAPDAAGDIRFTPPDAGTYWYRPLVPAHAAEQTERGLYGALIVEEETAPYADDLALMLDDIALEDGQVRASFASAEETGGGGRLGNRLLVNGRASAHAIARAPGSRMRLRIVNASNARPLTLRFEGFAVMVIAADGQPVDTPFPPVRDSITLVPGSRVDVVADVARGEGETCRMLAALGDGLALLTITVTGQALPAPPPVEALAPNGLPDTLDLAGARRVEIPIETVANATGADPARLWRLGGTAWADATERPLFRVPVNTPVTLALENRTPLLQVLHLHGHHARQLHRLDDGWEPYWLDTIAIPARQTVRVAFLADNPGRWMIGSGILDRLGAGLAGWFEVG